MSRSVPVVVPQVSTSAPAGSSQWIESPRAPASSPVPVVADARPSPPAPHTTGQELAAESALLDLARTAIARGEADHALAAVDRHATTFPRDAPRGARGARREGSGARREG